MKKGQKGTKRRRPSRVQVIRGLIQNNSFSLDDLVKLLEEYRENGAKLASISVMTKKDLIEVPKSDTDDLKREWFRTHVEGFERTQISVELVGGRGARK